ncbi:MFS transporter [Rathayibacter sp. AY1A3]|uniref:MFS transporter n=1 Tax=Rathayibacter sp. AY1A3 TaxID=2080521 RepID=UPI000CE7D975|nr:MFS transporter [Rathayibacter sp. AY1A3]PPF37945.1 MFS transporter [Rathayibacter sp. AY1A3]
MTNSFEGPESQTPPVPYPIPQAAVADDLSLKTAPLLSQKPVGTKYIWFVVLAQFGIFVAFITPIAISLAIKVSQIAPGQEEVLGYITGLGALAAVITTPLFGMLSDRTRSRFGRRRPFILGGVVVGTIALFIMATATSIPVLALGWILSQIGWGAGALSGVTTSTADRLSPAQRGKVAGLGGFATQVAPALGVGIAGALAYDNLLLFLVPGAIGIVLTLAFVGFIKEADSREMPLNGRLSLPVILTKFVFNPRKHKDYAWNWLGRFLFYFGLALSTTYTAYFFAQRLGVTLQEVAGVLVPLSLIGLVATTLGAIGGGFLSDKLKRRRVFVLVSALIYAGGAIVTGLAPGIEMLYIGGALTALGIGTFSAVDQALLLDVLPERETDAGRYMGIIGFAATIPQSVAPLIAPIFVGIGVAANGDKNYSILFFLAAAVVIAGGLVILRIRSVR